jgi:hypothetical protein
LPRPGGGPKDTGHFKVKACNDAGESAFSSVVSAGPNLTGDPSDGTAETLTSGNWKNGHISTSGGVKWYKITRDGSFCLWGVHKSSYGSHKGNESLDAEVSI